MKRATVIAAAALLVTFTAGAHAADAVSASTNGSSGLALNSVTLNRLSANRLSANRLAANRLAANGVQTGEGAASDIVAIELPNGNRATR